MPHKKLYIGQLILLTCQRKFGKTEKKTFTLCFRYNLLADRMRLKIKNEEKASGISPTRSELEEALEYLIEKEDASDEILRNNLNKKDDLVEREKAEEVRKVAMESLGATKKRKEDEKENSDKQPKRRRSAGSDTVTFLREKSEREMETRAADIELRKAQVELEEKKHNDMLQLLQQQQQQQMQAFSMLFQQQQQQQQQQAELFLKLFERLDKK